MVDGATIGASKSHVNYLEKPIVPHVENSLCLLCVLCVFAIKKFAKESTTEAYRRHEEANIKNQT